MTFKFIVGLIWIGLKAFYWHQEQKEERLAQDMRKRRAERVAQRKYEQSIHARKNQNVQTGHEQASASAAAKRTAAPQHVERVIRSTESVTGAPKRAYPTPSSANQPAPNTVQSQLDRRCKRVGELIKSRFSPTELTATRYRLLIDEVRLGVLSNLARQTDLLTSVEHLDRSKVENELARQNTPNENSISSQRLEMLKHVETRIAELEIANEQALHVLDRAIVTLASTRPLRGESGARLDRSVSDLEDMLSQAHRYGAGSLEDEFDIEPKKKKDKGKPVITPGGS